MATEAQITALKVADPWASQAMSLASQAAGTDVVGYWLDFAYNSWSAGWRACPSAARDVGVALVAALEFRLSLPDGGQGAGAVSAEARPGGSRSFASRPLPPGFPAHWYDHGNGQRAIGLLAGNLPPSFG